MQALKSKIKTVVSRINYTAIRNHGGPHISKDAPTIQITFINPNPSQAKKGQEDEKLTVDARIGETVLQTARRNHVDLEGACEGVCACSTCHIVLDNQLFDNLADAREDEEEMLGKCPAGSC
jgi:ferredoxin